MHNFFLLFFGCLNFAAAAQDIEDPGLRKPYRLIAQTGVALQWFDVTFKSFALSVEKPLNLYNHVGLQANFFFPREDGSDYRNISDHSYEAGVFAKCFFHGRLTGRRSNTYIGLDMRLGRRIYQVSSFSLEPIKVKASTFKMMARFGWQYHFDVAVLEFALPFGIEKENFLAPFSYRSGNSWFVASPLISLGIGL